MHKVSFQKRLRLRQRFGLYDVVTRPAMNRPHRIGRMSTLEYAGKAVLRHLIFGLPFRSEKSKKQLNQIKTKCLTKGNIFTFIPSFLVY